jgi:hypothetical protein
MRRQNFAVEDWRENRDKTLPAIRKQLFQPANVKEFFFKSNQYDRRDF